MVKEDEGLALDKAVPPTTGFVAGRALAVADIGKDMNDIAVRILGRFGSR